MRLLIAAACVAVIAFVGYFFWGEYSQSQARAQYAQAKIEKFVEDYCERISRYSAKYDKDYTASLGRDEVMRRDKQCSDFKMTGKMP